MITGKADDSNANQTLLGWGIIGPVTPVIDRLDELEESKSTCNAILTQEIGDPKGFHSKFVIDAQAQKILNPFSGKEMLKLGLFERNTNDEAHPKDRRFMKIVKGIGHREDGHCDIPLPLTDPNVELLNSRDGLPSTQALKEKICF